MYKEARKDRDTMEAECVRLRRELDAQSSFISSIRAQVASLPGCLDQQANRDVSTPPLAHAPPNRLPAAALDADSSTEASPGIAISRKVTPMPVTVQGSIDPGDADENESETEAQQQDDLDDSPGEVGGGSSRDTGTRKRQVRDGGSIPASAKRQRHVRVPGAVSTVSVKPVVRSSASRSPFRSKKWTRKSLPTRQDNMPPGIQYNEQGLRICGWCKEDQVGKKNPRWCPSGLGSGSICQKLGYVTSVPFFGGSDETVSRSTSWLPARAAEPRRRYTAKQIQPDWQPKLPTSVATKTVKGGVGRKRRVAPLVGEHFLQDATRSATA
ncbi:hypothetical protein EV121DRAFT_274674 [Schizophyllum commune]